MLIIEIRGGAVHYAGLTLSITPFVTVLNAILPEEWGTFVALKSGALIGYGVDPVPVDEAALTAAFNVSPPIIAAVRLAALERLASYKDGRLAEGILIGETSFPATGEAARRLSALAVKAAVDTAAGQGTREYKVVVTDGTAAITANQVDAIVDQVAEYGLTQEAAAVTAMDQVNVASTVTEIEAAIAAYLAV